MDTVENGFHDYRKKLGLRLRALREKLGETQVQLAKRLDVTVLTALKYESGATCPTAELLHRLEKSGADASYVVFGYPSLGNPSNRKKFWATLSWVRRECHVSSLKVSEEDQFEAAWLMFCMLSETTIADERAMFAKAMSTLRSTPMNSDVD